MDKITTEYEQTVNSNTDVFQKKSNCS